MKKIYLEPAQEGEKQTSSPPANKVSVLPMQTGKTSRFGHEEVYSPRSSMLGPKDEVVKEMFAQGLHWGHKTSRWNPKIKPYLYGVHRSVHVFDLNKTYEYFERALLYIRDAASQGKVIMLVGTRGPEKELIRETSKELSLPAVWEGWIGGTFTNFKEISQRIHYFNDLEAKELSGELEKYTKRERNEFHKEYLRLAKRWEGIKNLERLPDVLFATDIRENALAVKEARLMDIPIVAITDTNTDPTLVNYPIPANDDAITSVRYIVGKVKEAITHGLTMKQSS